MPWHLEDAHCPHPTYLVHKGVNPVTAPSVALPGNGWVCGVPEVPHFAEHLWPALKSTVVPVPFHPPFWLPVVSSGQQTSQEVEPLKPEGGQAHGWPGSATR